MFEVRVVMVLASTRDRRRRLAPCPTTPAVLSVPILDDLIRGKALVFFTSVVMAPVPRSRMAVTLNSSEKEAPERSDLELVRASTFT